MKEECSICYWHKTEFCPYKESTNFLKEEPHRCEKFQLPRKPGMIWMGISSEWMEE